MISGDRRDSIIVRVRVCRLLSCCLGAALLVSVGGRTLHAQTPPAGTLRCDVSGSVSFIIGSSRSLECTYQPTNGPTEFYSGRINKLGVDIGFLRSGVIIWGVLAPGIAGVSGALTGSYVGVSAEVAAGAGLGANALVSGNKIMLNPISIQGTTGINIAAGISGLTLDFVGSR